MTPLAYWLGCYGLLPGYFRSITITGQDKLPKTGPVVVAPTHRSRWDALLVPYAAGRLATGQDLHYMVTSDEMGGLQGWFIRQLGGFPVNPQQPAIASLRLGREILQQGKRLVIFPEGGIFRDGQVHPIKPGLARLAMQAERSQPGLGINVIPMSLRYGTQNLRWGCGVSIHIGDPLNVANYMEGSTKQSAQQLTQDLQTALEDLDSANQFSANSSPLSKLP